MQTLEQPKTIEIRQPRSTEIYRYLGLLAIVRESDPKNEYLRQQITTELAESLNAEMGTHGNPIRLHVAGEHLIDPSGRSMTHSAEAWSEAQRLRAIANPNLQWFADFAQIEAEEHSAVAAFAASAEDGESMMVISPFPEEAFADTQTRHTVQQEGFRPSIKRAFIRAYEKRDNQIIEHVQSVDSSDLDTWNEVHKQLGLPIVADTNQLLAQRTVHKGINGAELIERTVMLYDELLSQKTNKVHRFGKELGGGIEANQFVMRHPQIVADTIAELGEIANIDIEEAEQRARNALYNSKALINALYEQSLSGHVPRDINHQDIRALRSSEGASAAAVGKSYDGCAPSAASVSSETPQSAIHINSMTMKNGLEMHDCIKCPACTRIVTAIRDPKSGTWACPLSDCKGYNAQMAAKLQKGLGFSSGGEKDFGDLLVEFFFGNDKKKQASKLDKNVKRKLL